MGARIPPIERPRRGGIRCEFCGRVAPSVAALHSHQSALHSQALKEKAKQKPIATKPSKVQKPEQQKALVKKPLPKSPITYSNKSKNLPSDDSISKTPPIINQKTEATKQITVRIESPKPTTQIIKPKTAATAAVAFKAKTGTPKPKIEDSRTLTDNTKPKVLKRTEMEAKNKNSKSISKPRKTEYKCPKCTKTFPVLFVAQKHIQKHHCVNSKNERVAPNSPQIIQPILLELCIYCNEKFAKAHNCPNQPDFSLLSYDCSGCQQRFKNNKLFDMHVADVHGFHSESLFFPSKDEFLAWKEQMEPQTECEFILMGKYNSKEIYRCNEQTDNNTDDSVLLCPSTVILKKCPKGFQVNFYPAHYGHDFKKYDLKDQYKTFTITDLIQQAGYTNGNSDDDLYLQFKTLMESIVLDAAKINIDTLKTLMSRASDMVTILQDYDEDDEEVETVNRSTISLNTSSSSLRDEEEPKPIEVTTRTRKRGLEENNVPPKKIQKTPGNAKILVKSSAGKKSNTFSLADDKDSDKILKELDGANVKGNKNKASIQSPSFNDTYKDFIMNASKTGGTTTGKKRNVVKTKMGQFKGPSPKKVVKRDSIGKDIEYEVREQQDDCNILVLKI